MPRKRTERARGDPLTIAQILAWADAFHARCGRWPGVLDGPVADGVGLKWAGVNSALVQGSCGLDGGTTLSQLLVEQRGHRNIKRLPPLTEAAILAWADEHHQRTGAWPTPTSGT